MGHLNDYLANWGQGLLGRPSTGVGAQLVCTGAEVGLMKP